MAPGASLRCRGTPEFVMQEKGCHGTRHEPVTAPGACHNGEKDRHACIHLINDGLPMFCQAGRWNFSKISNLS